jgi:hypothetical protein
MGDTSSTKADWYPDPQGGPGVRWWDGDRWTEDTRAEHPRGIPAPVADPTAGPAATPPPVASGGPSPVGRDRLVVALQRPRAVGGTAYVFGDPGGEPLGTAVERAPADGSHLGERAETLDVYDAGGGAVLRLTKDRLLVDAIIAEAGWGPITPWGYVVLGPDLQPVAWAQKPGASHRPWLINVLGIDIPLGIQDQAIGRRRGAPRLVTMGGGVVVAQITLTSGFGGADTYLLELLDGPADGGLAITFVALVLMYDQIFRRVTPERVKRNISTPGSS